MELSKDYYYLTVWSNADVVMHFAGVEGPMRDEESQRIVDFGHHPEVNAYTEDQWHPLMRQDDSIPTTVFEVPAGLDVEIPEGLRNYADERV
jgi:hypothetical protein